MNPLEKLIAKSLIDLESVFTSDFHECEEASCSNRSLCSIAEDGAREFRDRDRPFRLLSRNGNIDDEDIPDYEPEEVIPDDDESLIDMPPLEDDYEVVENGPRSSNPGSSGDSLPLLTKPGLEKTMNDQDAIRQTPKAKPSKSARAGRRNQWRHMKNLMKFSQRSGKFENMIPGKAFEKFTIGELKEIVGKGVDIANVVNGPELKDLPPGLDLQQVAEKDPHAWMDSDMLLWDDEEADSPSDLLGFSWRSDPQTWEEKKWVKVDSVVDSGAFAPVAPPTMLPNVKVEPSPGSIRGQKYTSASKHKLKNLGQQKIRACTE